MKDRNCYNCFYEIDDNCFSTVGECTNFSAWKPKDYNPDICEVDSSHNNGGATDYYDLPEGVNECQSIIEWRGMNHAQGNIFKASFCFNTGRHDGTTYERELNKIIYYAKREKNRIRKD